jgi:HAD superfamily hydrolase (TIGR01509 family)
MIKLIIFDLDGVLVDAKEIHYEALNKALFNVDKKYVINREEHLSTYDGNTSVEKLKLLTKNKGLPYKLHKEIWETKQEISSSMIDELERDERLVEVLKRLRSEGYILACATNSIRYSAKLQLIRRGFLEHIDILYTNQDVINPKPVSEIYLRCIIKAGVNTKETIILEDSDLGREGARQTGAYVLDIEDSNDVTYEKIKTFINEWNYIK